MAIGKTQNNDMNYRNVWPVLIIERANKIMLISKQKSEGWEKNIRVTLTTSLSTYNKYWTKKANYFLQTIYKIKTKLVNCHEMRNKSPKILI